MTREEIIDQVRLLDQEQLHQLQRLLDQLAGQIENPPPESGPDPAAAESG